MWSNNNATSLDIILQRKSNISQPLRAILPCEQPLSLPHAVLYHPAGNREWILHTPCNRKATMSKWSASNNHSAPLSRTCLHREGLEGYPVIGSLEQTVPPDSIVPPIDWPMASPPSGLAFVFPCLQGVLAGTC